MQRNGTGSSIGSIHGEILETIGGIVQMGRRQFAKANRAVIRKERTRCVESVHD
jgi:hypothetical protein